MVGKIEVVFTPSVISYLDDLVLILYKKEYFGFIESAEKYVDDIYDAVSDRIKKSSHKKTQKPLKYLGAEYIFLSPTREQLGMRFLKKKSKLSDYWNFE
ncbi:hypothetical protein HYN56_09115 [Flavobacterium crocinum]|uniref:Uncharacterized protein n=1 Tax=Flavobacterium crocinum TaxID=2183896 RepID=A0A2S1YJZ6_9FLAO|nr:hypothetical protein [Flavobacterium crocinum]AWK04385.1 hypothetical protein HYN56_09115 [Flavobacterium crocinum]